MLSFHHFLDRPLLFPNAFLFYFVFWHSANMSSLFCISTTYPPIYIVYLSWYSSSDFHFSFLQSSSCVTFRFCFSDVPYNMPDYKFVYTSWYFLNLHFHIVPLRHPVMYLTCICYLFPHFFLRIIVAQLFVTYMF